MYFVSLIALLILGAFFAVSEISLAAAKRIRLQTLAEEGSKKAQHVLELQDHPGHFVTVIQIGINAVALAGGILGERFFTPFFTEVSQMFTPDAELAATSGFWLAFVTSTVLFILFADLIPKRLALIFPERVAMFIISPMRLLIKLSPIFIWFFNGTANFFIRLMGMPVKSNHKITSEDIISTVDAGTAAGVLASEEQAAIENIFEMESRTVPSSMTPREDIVYLLLDDSEDEIRHKVLETSHGQYLVCDQELDNVIGIVDSKDILKRLMSSQKLSLKEQGMVHPVQMVPDSLTLSEILECFKQNHTDFAVIINEYALVTGIITLNDVMSTVMGDLVISSEEAQILEREDGSWLVDGSTPIDDLEHVLGVDSLPEDSTYETVAGFMMYMLRKIPKRTDRVYYGDFRFEVIDVDNNKIDQIIVTPIKKEPEVKTEPSATAEQTVQK